MGLRNLIISTIAAAMLWGCGDTVGPNPNNPPGYIRYAQQPYSQYEPEFGRPEMDLPEYSYDEMEPDIIRGQPGRPYSFTEGDGERGVYIVVGLDAQEYIDELIDFYEEWKKAPISAFERYNMLHYLASNTNEINRQTISRAEHRAGTNMREFMRDYLIDENILHSRR